jgi:hypothetical protein
MATGDHFYTTSTTERNNAIETYGYADEGIACYVYRTPAPAGADDPVPFYRLYARWDGDHFYTTSQAEADQAVQGGYSSEGIACPIHNAPGANRVPFYRLYASWNGDHFYTTSAGERDHAITGGYSSEGIAGYVYPAAGAGLRALYRCYARWNGDHFYTTSQAERDSAVAGGYTNEGIACYVPVDLAATARLPLYRLYAPWSGDHFYTTNATERGSAIQGGYIGEGIACYVPSGAVAGSTPLYRLYAPWNGDHFYTTGPGERDSAVAGGYTYEGVACQVFAAAQPQTSPFFRLYRGMSKYLSVNVILVGDDGFSPNDLQQVRDSLGILRQIYAQVSIGIDNVAWYGISSADAGSLAVIDSESEAEDLTDDWTVSNNALDLFVVRSMTDADGRSAVDGSCDKDSSKGMTGSVVSLNGDAANSGNTFAHEIGHYLGLNHISDSGNFIGGDGSSDSWTGIYAWQGNIMKKHCFMHT